MDTSLTVAPLFYQLGLNTEHRWRTDYQTGMVIPGMFIMSGNQWSYRLGADPITGDIIDWYVDELQLDEIDCLHPQRSPNGTCDGR